MYQAYWGLRQAPFRATPDPRGFYRGPAYEEALARLHFLAEGTWRLGLVLGATGTGKTLLYEVFANELKSTRIQVGRVNLRGVEPGELLWQLCVELGTAPDAGESTIAMWRRLSDRLVEFRYQQIKTLLLLDDLDRALPGVCDAVARLLEREAAASGRLSIVASGDPARRDRLAPLLPLVDLRIDLLPWTIEDTEDYLHAALVQAGAQRPVFEPGAVHRLHELSGGNPRRVNQLAEMAILAGAAGELAQIDSSTVETVDDELGIPLPIASHDVFAR